MRLMLLKDGPPYPPNYTIPTRAFCWSGRGFAIHTASCDGADVDDEKLTLFLSNQQAEELCRWLNQQINGVEVASVEVQTSVPEIDR